MTRIMPVTLLLLLALGAARAEPVASFTSEASQGLQLLSNPDGQWERIRVADRSCVRTLQSMPGALYFYFRFDENTRMKITGDCWIHIEFYDSGFGSTPIQFNTSTNPYTDGPSTILLNSQEWAATVLHLANPKFDGKQNAGADFRIPWNGPLAISKIEVYTSEPNLPITPVAERARTALANQPPAQAPKDMFYTFGNDADEAQGALFKSIGVTSVESYVTWETVEGKGKDQWDWTKWDKQVAILKANNLKWVPFLILGPAYSTPDWFRNGPEHSPCRCLEHGIDSKVESLWNPNLSKWIDRFIKAFADHYRDSDVIESVLLGIQGDFGEAIYSVTGGGWTEIIPGKYHQHQGFWCNDPNALASFRSFARQRYGTLTSLIKAWGVEPATWEEVDFPARGPEVEKIKARILEGTAQERRYWLDFVEWYRAEMTRWSDSWIETTRRHFPDTPIYLCTGGDAIPEHGSNFAEQCRVAAKHNAGVRITNESSNYAANFSITRWVAAAGRHYNAYFGFEPAGAEDEVGIVARIYNATASGANQLHDYNPNVMTSATRLEAQRKHLPYLFRTKPIVPVALWYPETHLALKWGSYLEKAQKLRDYTDFDYLDESMLDTGALDNYKVLLILHGSVLETGDAMRIAEWVKNGGRLLVNDVPSFEAVDHSNGPEESLFGASSVGRSLGAGRVSRTADWDMLASTLKEMLTETGQVACDLKPDLVYCTQLATDRFLILNTAPEPCSVQFMTGTDTKEYTAKPGTISDATVEIVYTKGQGAKAPSE